MESQLDNPTIAFYRSIRDHLSEENDEEARTGLAASALQEASGREVAVATDHQCSRILEKVILDAPVEAIESFCEAAFSAEQIPHLASSPNGSHVAEKLITKLAANNSDKSHQILSDLGQAIADNLHAFLTDKFACHVARRFLNIAAGFEASPKAASHAQFPDSNQNEGNGRTSGLKSKLGGGLANENGSSDEMLDLLDSVKEAILSDVLKENVTNEYPYHPTASPFIQALLIVAKYDRLFLEQLTAKLIGCVYGTGGISYDVSVEDFHAMAQDKIGSHTLEVIIQVIPQEMYEAICEHYLNGHFSNLALHPHANFVVQAVISRVQKPSEMKTVVADLRSHFPELLRSKRVGVIASALAAAERSRTGQEALSKSLSAALRELPGNRQAAVPALLTLNTNLLLQAFGPKKRLATLGCVILSTIFKFIKEASSEYVESITSLGSEELVLVASDPGGSRVLESFLDSQISAKFKQKLVKKLHGKFANIAITPAGNFLVEKLFKTGNLKEKEAIVTDLSAHENLLSGQPRGSKLLARCHVADYKRGKDVWAKRVEKDAKVQQQFMELIGTPAKPDINDQGKKKKKRKQQDVEAELPLENINQENTVNESGKQNLTEKRKKKKVRT